MKRKLLDYAYVFFIAAIENNYMESLLTGLGISCGILRHVFAFVILDMMTQCWKFPANVIVIMCVCVSRNDPQ